MLIGLHGIFHQSRHLRFQLFWKNPLVRHILYITCTQAKLSVGSNFSYDSCLLWLKWRAQVVGSKDSPKENKGRSITCDPTLGKHFCDYTVSSVRCLYLSSACSKLHWLIVSWEQILYTGSLWKNICCRLWSRQNRRGVSIQRWLLWCWVVLRFSFSSLSPGSYNWCSLWIVPAP